MEESPTLQRQQQSSLPQQQPHGLQLCSLLSKQRQAADEKQQPSALFPIHKQAQEQWRGQQQPSYDAAPATAEMLPIEEPRDGTGADITAKVGFAPPVFATVRPPSPLAPYPTAVTTLTAYSTGAGAEMKLPPTEGLSSPCNHPDEAAAFTFTVPASALPCSSAAAIGSAAAVESAPSGAGHSNPFGDKAFRPANPAAGVACCPFAFRSSNSDVLPLRAAAPRLRCSAAVSDPGTRSSSTSSHAGTSSRRYDVSAGFHAANHNALGRAAGCRINAAAFQTSVASSQVAIAASRRIQHSTLPYASACAALVAPTDCLSYPTARDIFTSSNRSHTFSTSNLTSSSSSILTRNSRASSSTLRSSKSSLTVSSSNSSPTISSNNTSLTTSSTNSSLTTSSNNISPNVCGENSSITPSNNNNSSLFGSMSDCIRGVRSSITSVSSESAYRDISRSGACSSNSSTLGSGDGLLHKLPRPLSASVLKRLLDARRCRLRKTPLLRFLEGGSIDFEEGRRKRGSGWKTLSSKTLSNSNKMLSSSSSSEALSSRYSSGKLEGTSSAGGRPHLACDSTTAWAAAAASMTRTVAVETCAAVGAAVNTGTLEARGGCSTVLAGCRTPINIFLYYGGDAGRNRNSRSAAANGRISAVGVGNAAAGGDAGNSSSVGKTKNSPSFRAPSNDGGDNFGSRSVGSSHIQNQSCQGGSSPVDGGVNEASSSISTTQSLRATNVSRVEELQQIKKHKKGEEAPQQDPPASEEATVRAAQREDSLQWCGEQILQQMQTEPLLAAAALRARRHRPLFHQSVLADAASEALRPPAGGLQAAAARGGDAADDVKWSAAVSAKVPTTAAAGGPLSAGETCRETTSVVMRKRTPAPVQSCTSPAASTWTTDIREWKAWRQWEDADLVPPPQELDELLTILASAVKVRIAEVMALACGAEAAEHRKSKSAFPTAANAAFETAAATVFTTAAGFSVGDVDGDAAAPTGGSHAEHFTRVQQRTATSGKTDNWHVCPRTDLPGASETSGKSHRVLRLRHVLQAAAELPAVAALTPSLSTAV